MTDIPRSFRRLVRFLGGQVIGKSLYFLGIVAATRAVGPDGWGLLTAAISIGLIGATLVDLGLKPYVAREVAAKRIPYGALNEAASRYRSAATFAFALAAPVVMLITIPGMDLPLATVLVAYLLLDSWAQFFFAMQRGAEITRFETAGFAAEKAVFAALTLAILIRASNSPTLAVGLALALAAAVKLGTAVRGGHAAFGSRLNLRRLLSSLTSRAAWRNDMPILRESLPFLFMALFTTVYFRIDSYMLATLVDTQEAGYYGAAYKLVEGLLFAPASVMAVFGPALVAGLASRRVYAGVQGDQDSAEELVRHVAGLQVLIGGVLTGGLIFEAEWIVQTLYGGAFGAAEPILLGLGPAFFFMNCNLLLGTLMTSVYRQNTLLLITGLGVVVNVALNAILIPRLHAFGAVAATLATEGLVAIGMLIQILPHVPVRWILAPAVQALAGIVGLVVLPAWAAQNAAVGIRIAIETTGGLLVLGLWLRRIRI